MANGNQTNPKLPVQYILPDGDIAAVVTWPFIIDRLEQNLNPIIDELTLCNQHLTSINVSIERMLETE
jgi:hypothetical protein